MKEQGFGRFGDKSHIRKLVAEKKVTCFISDNGVPDIRYLQIHLSQQAFMPLLLLKVVFKYLRYPEKSVSRQV